MGGEKLWYAVLLIRSWRITPAWAGKRMSFFASSELDKDHPRVGGEKFSTVFVGFLLPGSPPRGRGKAYRLLAETPGTRITPAWAGKSQQAPDVFRLAGDHPRVGGEKQNKVLSKSPMPGSPPRGRGKEQVCCCETNRNRITPAWAGKRQAERQGRFCPRDHPRVGGEKTGERPAASPAPGSPPRGRGKGFGGIFPGFLARITPAWAGKSRRHAESRTKSKDHPRVGGEKLKQRMCSTAIAGSPPRGRGKD